jgi:hypothetical protein
MFDVSILVETADRRSPGLSLAVGFLIAGSCFALLFVAMAHLIPLFLRFVESPQGRLLQIVPILSILVSGLVVYLRRRAKKPMYRANSRSSR